MKRLAMLLVVVAAAVATTVFAPAAVADQPVMSQYTFSVTNVLTDACSFPITVDSTASVAQTNFYDTSGLLTTVYVHVNEHDTFSANGRSLTGVPFTFNIEALFDISGNITHEYVDGVIEKVPLPDGSFFLTAGRLDFAAHGFPEFLLTPDTGATVNLAGFCAALSP
jgi:hypothetical protein